MVVSEELGNGSTDRRCQVVGGGDGGLQTLQKKVQLGLLSLQTKAVAAQRGGVRGVSVQISLSSKFAFIPCQPLPTSE